MLYGYFRAFLVRLPNYNSIQCQCSERMQSVKHLLLGCGTYQNEREAAGIARETTLHPLLFDALWCKARNWSRRLSFDTV